MGQGSLKFCRTGDHRGQDSVDFRTQDLQMHCRTQEPQTHNQRHPPPPKKIKMQNPHWKAHGIPPQPGIQIVPSLGVTLLLPLRMPVPRGQ